MFQALVEDLAIGSLQLVCARAEHFCYDEWAFPWW
jgi:hypothetical protein